MKKHKGLISFFIQHKVAANLLMLMMILLGAFGLYKLNTQFLPNFKLNYITVSVPWFGASASDVERSIIVPLEKQLKDIDGLKKIRSNAKSNAGLVILEFNEKVDVSQAFQDTQQRVSAITNLPSSSEKPIITKIERYDPIAKIILTGPSSLSRMRQLAYDYEDELLRAGIAKINIIGLPKLEFAVEVPQEKLRSLGMTLPELANIIDQYSADVPLGTVGKNDVSKDLRMIEAVRTVAAISGIPISDSENIHVSTVGNIAHVSLRKQDGETTVFYQGKPAIELQLLRTQNENALTMAGIMHEWVDAKQTIASVNGIHLKIYDESWILIKDRISLLLKNGTTGLIFIIIVLLLFLNRRVAWWVGVGVPVSCLATFFILFILGDSINMISLFAIIMTLGIIVDDTIVVGENAYSEFRNGMSPEDAARAGAKRMLIPVLASSLTTIAAFLPLMLVSDIIGQVLFSIPLVVICVIIASLLECFFVLPYHLKHSFTKMQTAKTSNFRKRFDQGFATFRDKYFYGWLVIALKWRWTVIVAAISMIILTISLLIGSHVPFTFFKMPDSNIIKLNVTFVPGTPESKVKEFLQKSRAELFKLNQSELKEYPDEPSLVKIVMETLGVTSDLRGDQSQQFGENTGHLSVELSMPDERSLSNQEFINLWKSKIYQVEGIDQLVISSPVGGPPGRDIDIRLSSKNPFELKKAALYVKDSLNEYQGVKNTVDNMPDGREQWVFELTQAAIAKGLTVKDLASQVSSAYAHNLVQRITEGQDEIDVNVLLADKDRKSLAAFEDFPIKLPNGIIVPLESVVTKNAINGFDRLVHQDGQLVANVTAEVDDKVTNANHIIDSLQTKTLDNLQSKFNVNYTLTGKFEEQNQTFADMLAGLVIGLVLIYVILALVFSSYGWPLLVMVMIPLGLIGAVLGHLLMGYDMTILSLFGLFGLSGIVVNDSIILLSFYKERREQGMLPYDAIIHSAKSRLRPVLLTSITTIVGLTPLLFETSLQAKFLIPMAISIVFGLAFATLLILFVLPSMLAIYEKIRD
ncbi:MAG: multidrug efflux pump subunit AcrB [Francisellaceae bacterium]|jgi:multidrug efflux pump subunit AcrB